MSGDDNSFQAQTLGSVLYLQSPMHIFQDFLVLVILIEIGYLSLHEEVIKTIREFI